MAESESCTVNVGWLGLDIVMNEKLTQDIITGTTAAPAISTLVVGAFSAAGVLTGGLATIIGGAFGAAFALKTAEIKWVDNGNGVHWPVTWFQLGGLVASSAGGIPGLVAGLMLWIHPFRL